MKTQTFVIYEGASLLDGGPIVALAQIGTRNRKIGNMMQTFILRSDVDPVTANAAGLDVSICGSCPLRAAPRTCYVLLFQAPLSKYKAYKRGVYPVHQDLPTLGRDRMIRIGAYGDGAAVPPQIWDDLCREAKGWTAYTHQGNPDPGRYMTSVEALSEAQDAWGRGERTFRIVASELDVTSNEVLCPSARTTCADCGLCAGASIKAKSITIVAHGAPKEQLRREINAREDIRTAGHRRQEGQASLLAGSLGPDDPVPRDPAPLPLQLDRGGQRLLFGVP